MPYVLPAPALQLTFIDLILKDRAGCDADPQLRVLGDGPDGIGPRFSGKLHTKHGVIS
jgi:hypothetical protein